MSCNIGQLILSPESKNGSIGKILVSQPSLNEERWLGRLFVIAEIHSQRTTNQALVDFIFNQLNRQYYSEEQLLLLERTSTISVEQIFESVVADLNNQLIDFFSSRNPFVPASANLTIGVIHRNSIFFANLGANKGLLIYQPKQKDGGTVDGFNLLNITAKVTDPTQDIIDPNKLFSNVIKGGIPQGAAFLLTNESLYEYLSEKQLIKIVSTLPAASAALQIRNVLEQTAVYVPFLALIVKNSRPNSVDTKSPLEQRIRIHQANEQDQMHRPSKSNPEKIAPAKDVNKESIKALNLTESRTAEILKPSGLIGVSFIKFFGNLLGWRRHDREKHLIVKREQLMRHKTEKLLLPLFKLSLSLLALLSQLIGRVYRLLTDSTQRQAAVANLKQTKQSLTVKHWLALSVMLASVLLLIGGVWWNNQAKQQSAKRQAFEQTVQDIDRHFSDLAAIMIYDNLSAADEHLRTIKQLTDNLKAEPDQQSTIEKINQRYQQAFEQTYKFTNLGDAVWLKTDNWQFVDTYRQQLWLSAGQNIQLLDTVDPQKQTTINNAAINDCRPISLSEYADKIYCLTDNKVLSINLNSKQTTDLNLAPIDGKLLSASIYNGRLYGLSDQGQVYRFSGQTDGWTGPQSWLSSGSQTVSQAADIAIDGSVFVANQTTIKKYRNGQEQTWSPAVYPPLSAIAAITTNKNSSLIYVYSRDYGGRVVAINKDNGALVAQYSGQAWDKGRDLTISEDGRQAYLLLDFGLVKLPR